MLNYDGETDKRQIEGTFLGRCSLFCCKNRYVGRGFGIFFSLLVISFLIIAIVLQSSVGKGFHAAAFSCGAIAVSFSLALNTRLPITKPNYITGFIAIIVTFCTLISCIAFLIGWFSPISDTFSMGFAFFVTLFMFFISVIWTIANLKPPENNKSVGNDGKPINNDMIIAYGNEPVKKEEDKISILQKACNIIVLLLWLIFALLLMLFSFEAVNSVKDFYTYVPPLKELIPIGGPIDITITFSPTVENITIITKQPTTTLNPTNNPTTLKPTNNPTTLNPTNNPTLTPTKKTNFKSIKKSND